MVNWVFGCQNIIFLLYIISQTHFSCWNHFFFSQTLILVAPLPISLSPRTHTGTAAPLTQIFFSFINPLSFHRIPAGSSPLRTASASLSEALEFFQSRSNFLNLKKRGKVCNYFRYKSSIFVLLSSSLVSSFLLLRTPSLPFCSFSFIQLFPFISSHALQHRKVSD